ncbi:FliG C-terminal domain-containing protein [Enterobacter ludwigii]|uniref:FliG C-terminal domain-containing protein n=1 Tax=Enterobacter ludwigii TaxID=299767 RepID=UPI003F71B42A
MSEATTRKSNKNTGCSRLDKAAILLLSIGEEAAAKVMQRMCREEVLVLSQTMARLHDVKLVQVRQVFNQFFEEYSEQSGINGASRSYLKVILDKALGGEISRSVINGIYGDEIRQRMSRLQWIDTPHLTALIAQEHLQLQAVFLAFLPPDVAASVFSSLPEERRDEIIYRIARLDEVNPDVIAELDRLIARGVEVMSEHGTKVVGIKQAANIVNRITDNQQELLNQLRIRDDRVAESLTEEMYEFYILSRQTPQTIQRLLEEIPLEEWAVALKGTEPLLRHVIFNELPKRQVSLLESCASRMGPVPISRIEEVRKEIMSLVRQLAEEGEIQVRLFAEATVE